MSAPVPSPARRAAAPAPPQVRSGFARADDGIEVYWRAVGEGPVICCCNGVGVSTFFWKYLVAAFSDRYTVIVWDYRGHGKSARLIDPNLADLSIARHADDCATVLATVAGDDNPAVMIGHSMGCQVALETRRRHPERALAVVLALGTAGRALSTFFDNPAMPAVFDVARRVIFRLGSRLDRVVRPALDSPLAWAVAVSFKLVDPFYTRREDMLRYMEHLASLDLRLFIECAVQTQAHDAWDLLPALGCPLLVIAAENDKFTPMWCSRKMVAITPGAELLVLADGSHAALIEQPETINHRLERFLLERVAPLRP